MTKLWSLGILFFLIISQFQVGVIYAAELEELQNQKDTSSGQLNDLGDIIETAVKKLDAKIGDEEKSQKLQKKGKEIEEYIEDAQREIEAESSTKDIQEKVEKVKKIVLLKVVSGVTDYENIEDSIGDDVAGNQEEKREAAASIQDSLTNEEGDYSLIVKTKYKGIKLKSMLGTFDDSLRIDFMYAADGENYFEVFFAPDSLFRQEMLTDIESGVLPASFIGVNIVSPEVFGIDEIQLEGENMKVTWGIEKYKSYNFIDQYKTASQKIRVGVVDTGIDYNHPDLKNNVDQTLGKDFVNDDDDAWDDQGHGTHVAGTIAANINGFGIIGVNPYVELVPLKICNSKGFCPSYAVLRALDYAKTHKIDILNMSLGGRGNPEGHAICQGIASVVTSGGIVVAASGNSNIDTSRFVPGGCASAITVGATDSENARALFSNYGSKVDVSAPGVQVYSTYPGGGYKQLSGTSMATPHIVGIISLMQSQKSNISSSEVKLLLKKYPESITLDRVDKIIAAAVDVPALLKSFEGVENLPKTQAQEENITQKREESHIEEAKETGTQKEFTLSGEESGLLLTAQNDSSIGISQENNAKQEGLLQEDDEVIYTVYGEAKIIEFGESGVQINTLEGEIISESVSPEVIQLDRQKSIPESQIFDENGKDISQSVEINSSESFKQATGLELPDDFDVHNLPDSFIQDEVADNAQGDLQDSQDILEAVEVFIDGAETGVEINSAPESFSEFTVFDGEDAGNQGIVDENGELISLGDVEIVELDVENIVYKSDDELLIDGAQPGVEINSSEEPQQQNITEFQDGMLGESPEIGEALIGYDQQDIIEENIPDIEKQEFHLIDAPREIIEEIIFSPEEILIDGAEPGVEINSFGDTTPDELLEQAYVPESDELYFQTLDEYEIIGVPEIENREETGVEINSSDAQELIEISPKIEVIEPISIQDISFDEIEFELPEGYEENGVEINSALDEEKIEIVPEVVTYNQALEISEGKVIDAGEVPTPYDFKDDVDDKIGDNELIEISSQEYIESEQGEEEEYSEGDFGASIQNTYYCTVEVGSNCKLRIYKGYYYSFVSDNPNIYSASSGRWDTYITGRQAGTSELKLYQNGRQYHTIYITVKKQSPPKEYTLNIQEQQQGKIYLPGAYSYTLRSSDRNIYISRNSSYIYISGSRQTESKIYVYAGNSLKGIIHVKIFPKQVPIYKKTLEVGQNLPTYLYYAHRYNYSFSKNDVVSVSTNSRYFYVSAKKSGNVQVYVRYGDTHIYTLDITIPEPPKPKIYEVTLQEGNDTRIYFPDSINYGFYTEKKDSGNAYAGRSGSMFYLRGYTPGNIYYHVKNNRNQTIYLVKLKIVPKPPIVINLETYVGKYIYAPLRYASQHTYTSSNPSISQNYSSYYSVSFRGLQVGTNQIYVHQGGIHRYTIDLKVKEIPKPQDYKLKIVEGESSTVYFPEKSYYRIYYRSHTGGAHVYGGYGSVSVRSYLAGEIHYAIYDSNGFYRYNLHITISPKPPVVKTISNYEGRAMLLDNMNFDTQISYSQAGIVNVYRAGGYRMGAIGLKPGDLEVYFKDGRGRHFLTYKVQVKPIPEPKKIYSHDIFVGQYVYISLPDEISNYRVSSSGDGKITNMRLNGGNRLELQGFGEGKYTLHYTGAHGFDIYRVELNIKLQEEHINVHLSEKKIVRVRSDDSIRYAADNIARIHTGRPDRVEGLALGKTEIFVTHRNGYMYKKIYVTVLPKPKPIELTCETRIHSTCRYSITNGGYYFTESKTGIAYIDTGKTSFRIKGRDQGTITLYIKAKYANYISHIFTIHVLPEPVREYDCTMPVGTECHTYWSGEKYEYTYKLSRSDIAKLSLEYYRQGDKRMNRLRLKGISQGSAQVYVYDAFRHVATFHIIVEPAVSRIQLSKHESTIREGEGFIGKIENGGGAYKSMNIHDREILSFSASGNETDKTGKYKYSGIKPGKTTVGIQDQYGQITKFGITVLPANLRLSSQHLRLSGSNYEYISVQESYKGIKSLKMQDSSIAQAYYVSLKSGDNVIRVNPISSGTTYLEVRDHKDSVFVVKIEVGGGKKGVVEEKNSEDTFTEADKQEIEKLLQEIFTELGIQNTETRINNSFTLSQSQKEKIDSVIKNWVNKKGKASVLTFKKGIPILKEKYSSYEHGIILDYLNISIEKILEFRIIHNISDTSNGNIGGLQFEVSNNLQGKISNVGVQYLDKGGNQKRKELKLQSDGTYIVAFSSDSCSGCTDLKPYYLLSGRTDIFIASSGNNIEIANSAYKQFQDILTSIWNWKGYSKEGLKEEIIELKEDYDDYASLTVSLFPGVGEVYDIGTLVLGKDPITGEELGPISKAFTLAGLLSGLGSGKAARDAGNKTLDELRKELNLTQEEIETIALDIIKDIKVDNISDLVRFKEKLGFKAISSKIKSIVYVSRYSKIKDGDITTSANFLGLTSKIQVEDSNNLLIKEAFKNEGEEFFMSDLILAQVKYLGQDTNNISSITLKDVVNEDIRNALIDFGQKYVIDNWGKIDSIEKRGGLDKMSIFISHELGKNIDEIKIFKAPYDFDDVYDIKLILK